jgi:hypothetical protein
MERMTIALPSNAPISLGKRAELSRNHYRIKENENE